jgi:hypothetical protein
MKIFKHILDFYINSSIHVGLSCYALVRMTQMKFHIFGDESVAYFAFFGTIVGYNFVKYDALARAKKFEMRNQLKGIAVFSFCALLLVGYYFWELQRATQLVSVAVLGITLLYTLSFFPNKKNARNWVGLKIYIVALCWAVVTVVLPFLNSKSSLSYDFFLESVLRFILVFVLILIFEIIDLTKDDPHLKTVPQQIGVKQTKILGILLLLVFCGLELFNSNFQFLTLIFEIVITFFIALFLVFASEKRSKYYTSFWVESLPILWWLLLNIFL